MAVALAVGAVCGLSAKLGLFAAAAAAATATAAAAAAATPLPSSRITGFLFGGRKFTASEERSTAVSFLAPVPRLLADSPGQKRSSSTITTPTNTNTAIPPCAPQRKKGWRNPHLPAQSLEDSDSDDSDSDSGDSDSDSDDTLESFSPPACDNRNNGNNNAEEATTVAIMQPPPLPRLPQDTTLLSFGEYTDGKLGHQDKRRDKRKNKDRGGGGGGGGLPRGSIDWTVVDCAFCARESCVCGWTTVQQKCMLSLQRRGATVGQQKRAAVGQKARQKARRGGGGEVS